MGFKYHISGMGAALVDVFANVSEAELAALGSTKAAMVLIDAARARELAARITPHAQSPGGSAANTIAGIGSAGLDAAFIGKIGDDAYGALFRDALHAQGVYFETAAADLPTGHCIVLVTPDAERTLHTLLGASVTTAPADCDPNILAASGLFFAEAYVWDSQSAREAFRTSAQIVRGGGGRCGLSLSDSLCVKRHHADFRALADTTLDFIIGNAEEAKALFGGDTPADNLAAAKTRGLDMVITDGAAGAAILWGGAQYEVAAIAPQKLVDLTGAGDQFAAGFLSGCAKGYDGARAAQMGAIAAAEVIAHFGPRPLTPLAALFD